MPSDLLTSRLYRQRLSGPPCATAAEAVSWLGAVQSQDFGGGKWALAQRMGGVVTEADLDAAFDRGDFLRTHVLRPTWHFVVPADLRWMLVLTGDRVIGHMGTAHRQLGLTDKLLARCGAALVKALQGGVHLTRPELMPVLAKAGLSEATAERGPFVLGWAEAKALLCSGARRGKQHTYALLDERAPQTAPLEPEAAAAALARRYFTSRGPATLADFTWWSGLTLTQAKAAIEAIKADLAAEDLEGERYYAVPSAVLAAPPAAYLLPNYDEYTVAYAGRAALFDDAHTGHLDSRGNMIFENVLILAGRAAGTWRHTVRKAGVEVALKRFRPLSADEDELVAAAVARYGAYLGLPATRVQI